MSNIPNLDDMLKLYTKKDLWERIQHHIKRIDNLQSQLDQQKARIEELEGQFAYECECNKQFVQLQNMWNELKEWLEYRTAENGVFDNYDSLAVEDNLILDKMQELEAEDE